MGLNTNSYSEVILTKDWAGGEVKNPKYTGEQPSGSENDGSL